MEVCKSNCILFELCRCGLEITLARCLLLTARRNAVLCLGHFLGGVFDFVFQGLLQHLKVMKSCSLLVPRLIQLALRLLKEILESADNPSTLSLVHRCLWSSKADLAITIFRLLRTLNKGCKLLGVSRRERRSPDEGTECLSDAACGPKLHHGGTTFLHLPLQDTDGSLQSVNDLKEFLFLSSKVCCLAGSKFSGCLQVCLICRGACRKLLHLGCQ
mmetsp:Transcript_152161/g.369546  ORF Transcript_152161/g.369546 Transcript_152161/m.369546 type:complete len:216 (-) Transcript_152161:354-1001(-)